MNSLAIHDSEQFPLAEVVGANGLIVDGDWVESKDQDPGGDVRLIQLADIGIGQFLDKSNRFLTSEKARKLGCTFLKPGDILVARMPDPIGRACVFPGSPQPCVTVVDVCIVRPDASKVSNRWLSCAINSPFFARAIDKYVKGTTRQRISRTNLESICLPFPSLDAQKRIAAILDAAADLRAKRNVAITKIDSLAQSIFVELFGDPIGNPKGWTQLPLSEIVCKITDGEHLNPPFSSAGMPIVMAGNVLDDLVDIPNAKKVTELLGAQFRRKCNPEKGDLLLVSRGATIGRLCRVQTDQQFCLMGSVILIKLDPEIILDSYLSAFLKMPIMKAKLYSTSGSSAQQAIYLKDLKHLSCPVPDMESQQKYDTQVNVMEKQKSILKKSFARLDALFGSLQARAFEGEL